MSTHSQTLTTTLSGMKLVSNNSPSSNDSPRTVRFENWKAESLSTDCEAFTDLPQLICKIGTCNKLCSFGGFETFTKNEFTKNDVCMEHDM